jgi:hypothetical protein
MVNKKDFESIFHFMNGIKKVCRQKEIDIGVTENYRKEDYLIEFHLHYVECNFEIKDYVSLCFGSSFEKDVDYEDITSADIDEVVGEIDSFIIKVNSIQGLKLNTLSHYIGEED